MQWKLGHIVAVVVALTIGWLGHGLVAGRAGEGTTTTGGPTEPEPTQKPAPTETLPVEKLVAPETTYLMVGRSKIQEHDFVWIGSGADLLGVEVDDDAGVGIARIEFESACQRADCLPCRDDGPVYCPTPMPPPNPSPRPFELEYGALRFESFGGPRP